MGSNPVIDKLDDIAYEYINTYRTIKMNSADVKSSTYKGFVGENNNKAPKVKVRDHVRISKHFLQKVTLETGLKKFLGLKKWTYVIEGRP